MTEFQRNVKMVNENAKRCGTNFGSRMRELRDEKGLYQKELAAVLKVSTGTVCNYEKNTHFPDADTLVRLADFFDVSIDYLMCRTDLRSNLNKFNKEICPGYSVAKLVNMIVSLEPQQQDEVRQYTEYVKIMKKKSPRT